MAVNGAAGRYIEYLPAILQQGKLVGPLLLALERVLSGPPAEAPPPEGVTPPEGLEQILDRVHTFWSPLDPQGNHAPEEFLPWLAGWVATSLKDDWSPAVKRAFLARVVELYKKRGTAAGLREVLELHAPGSTVLDHDDDATPPQFNDASPDHLFKVILDVPSGDVDTLARNVRRAISIIDQWKPAHTYYFLQYNVLGMQINDESCTPRLLLDPSFTLSEPAECSSAFGPGVQIGVNTMVGSSAAESEMKLKALEINDDPDLHPSFGGGVLVGINTLLGTEP